MNTHILFCIKVSKQLVKLGKYFADFNFRRSRLTGKCHENWTTRKFPILQYSTVWGKYSFNSKFVIDNFSTFEKMFQKIDQGSQRLEKYLNIQGCLEKSLKIKFALKST